MFKNNIYTILLIGTMVLTLSCEDVLEPAPEGQIRVEDLFSNEENAITAMNGVYNVLPGLYSGGSVPRLADQGSDDGWHWRAEVEVDDYSGVTSDGGIQRIWTDCYTGITRANTVLNGIPEVPIWSSNEMPNIMEGQAKFLRGFYYYHLVRLFGGVPLIAEVIMNIEEAQLPRASLESVYNLMKSDLTDAINLLPTAYSGGRGQEAGRATKYAAQTLLAYVHLELEEWAQAESQANAVIGQVSLLNYADYFNGTNENGAGTIFEIQYAAPGAGRSNGVDGTFAPPEFNGGAAILPTDDNLNNLQNRPNTGNGFVQAYEEGDLRRDVTLATYGIANFLDPSQPDGSLIYVNKYYNASVQPGESPWNLPVLRYPDPLLIAAEALNEQGYVADGTAFEHLNTVRTNAGLTPLTSADLPTKEDFTTALRQERRMEFAFEFRRLFDLNRWGILASAVGLQLELAGRTFPTARTSAHPITGKNHFLFPIPLVEFLNNPNLVQNPGY